MNKPATVGALAAPPCYGILPISPCYSYRLVGSGRPTTFQRLPWGRCNSLWKISPLAPRDVIAAYPLGGTVPFPYPAQPAPSPVDPARQQAVQPGPTPGISTGGIVNPMHIPQGQQGTGKISISQTRGGTPVSLSDVVRSGGGRQRSGGPIAGGPRGIGESVQPMPFELPLGGMPPDPGAEDLLLRLFPFAWVLRSQSLPSDVILLARLIYAAAAREWYIPNAMEGVGWVVRHRVESGQFPTTYEGVIFQTSFERSRLIQQFDEVGSPRWREAGFPPMLQGRAAVAYARALVVAERVYYGTIPDPTQGALYFPSGPTSPWFQRALRGERIQETGWIWPFTFYK